MSSFFTDIKLLNTIVFKHLEEILKMLDKKLDLKLYSIVLDNNSTCKEVIRVKKTLSLNNDNKIEINQENLNELHYVFNELDLDTAFDEKELGTNFLNFCNKQEFILQKKGSKAFLNDSEDNENLVEIVEVDKKVEYAVEDKSRILYTSSFNVKIGKVIGTVIYIIEIRNVDLETFNLFYTIPELSFLRMVLDYYFIDYFVENQNKTIKIDRNNTKYNEDSIQFNRRITRLYFGKIQELLKEKSKLEEIQIEFENNLNNQYYINNMLEKIDDISNRTYEGNSPFGSILLLNQEVLKSDKNIVDYTIKFQSQDLVELNDAKLIRKLLELTNNEKDLHLISDHEMIYGLGRINWNQLNGSILFRIDFRGLSKYNIHLITTKETDSSIGRVVFEGGKKIYKTSKNLEVVEKSLVKLSFKSPIIGGEGYTSEKFKRLLKSQYFDEGVQINEEVMDYLEEVVRHAREQKHGTMVVITDYDTAISELKTLKKQSILIESIEIMPEYIKFLTSIDGAIYFDTNGKCHAIGVILDGIARADLGDSSRGARYNSAYRYLEKLKDCNKKCVIVIISEDGMVNLIPETDNEEKIYALFQQMIDLLNEDKEKSNPELNDIEELLMNNNNIDYHLFFKVAEIYQNKNNYVKAIEFYKKGLAVAGTNIIIVNHYRNLAISYFHYAREVKTEKRQYFEEAINIFDKYIVKSNENELTLHDYNNRAISFMWIGDVENEKDSRHMYFKKAFNDFSKAIEISKSNATLFYNRSKLMKKMEMIKECLEDLIEAEFIASNEKYINDVINLIKGNIELLDYCVRIILEKSDDKSSGDNLIKRLEEYGNNFKEQTPEIATTLERLHL